MKKITPGQIRHLLRVTEATSRHPKRDAAILLLGLSCTTRYIECDKRILRQAFIDVI